MKNTRHNITGKVVACLLGFLIILQTGCTHNNDFDNHSVKERPRARVGRYASPSVGTVFAGAEDLGVHGYYSSWSEKIGIAYTCKAGHIDLAHVRKSADWTAYLAANILEELKKNETKFSFKFKEPTRYYVQLTYPDWWKGLPEEEKNRITRDISIRLGQYFTYVGCNWHEILTWFGYRSVALYPEFPSAFSWEDSFSDLLGTHIAAKALRDSEHEYDEAMTLALKRELDDLGIQPRDVAIRASNMVRGLWFSGDFLFLVDMKGRNFDIGLDDGFVTPWLVPSLAKTQSPVAPRGTGVRGLPECEGAQPQSYPAPSLDFLSEYGFSAKFEFEPKELERHKILSIVYPDPKERRKRIEPAAHFPAIMANIMKDAVEKHGFYIGTKHAVSQAASQQPPQVRPSGVSPSKPAPAKSIIDDVNNDGVIDLRDMAIIMETWLAKCRSAEDTR
jgi:hypothetical protein